MKSGLQPDPNTQIEWPTLGLAVVLYLAWVGLVFWLAPAALGFSVLFLALVIALHASLTHETIHGHPFRSEALNAALVYPALGILYPYRRFRDTHRAHHAEPELTDPHDDPESNYLAKADWARVPMMLRWLFRFNNTLLGRLLVGPAIGTAFFITYDMRQARKNRQVLWDWGIHIPAVLLVLLVVWASPMPLWAYLCAAYLGQSIIRIRTFLEHQAHEASEGRTVIIEDRGLLGFLFLNNNLHAVHHAHPDVPCYKLPALFQKKRKAFLAREDPYYFTCYGSIFRQFFSAQKTRLSTRPGDVAKAARRSGSWAWQQR